MEYHPHHPEDKCWMTCVEERGMTLTVHTGRGVEDILVFENVHVDSVKVKDDTLQWEEDGGRLRTYSIPLSRVLYWESE